MTSPNPPLDGLRATAWAIILLALATFWAWTAGVFH